MRFRTLAPGFITVFCLLLATGDALAVTSFPISSRGDIWFQADHAAFEGDDGQPVEEYYFRINNNQLKFEERDDYFEGRVFLKLKFKDLDGQKIGEAGHNYEFRVPNIEVTQSPSHAQLLLLREALDPRTRFVEIEVEDLNARKRGLLYMVTGKRKNGAAEGELVPPTFPGKAFASSDIQFAWEVRTRTEESMFEKNGFDVVPNPARSYGLLQPLLSAYVEVYDNRESRPEGQILYHLLQEVLSPDSTTVRSKRDTVGSRSPDWVNVVSFDVSNLPTGEYRLRLVITDAESGEMMESERPFNILWKNQFWAYTEEDIANEAKVLFEEDDYDQFMMMSAGEREVHLETFWADRDPSPGTAQNEIRNEFMRRVDFANRMYKDHGRRGMLTDRGRIFIRYGEPDEIDRELMPTGTNQLDGDVETLSEIDDRGRLLQTTDGFDTRPFETWIYTRQGRPLFPHREEGVTVNGLQFVFIDETGTGHYVLRFQSDFIGY